MPTLNKAYLFIYLLSYLIKTRLSFRSKESIASLLSAIVLLTVLVALRSTV